MSDSLSTITGTLSATGRTNTPPATLLANLIAQALALSPGLTVLPAGLIEDVSSTDAGAAVIIDQAVTEVFANISPYVANLYVLSLLGQVYLGQGSTAAAATNTSVYVVFSGAAGFIIGPGFTVSDGTYQYTVQNGGAILSGDSSDPIYCLATQTGTWGVPANTVTQLVTSAPTAIGLSCTNPLAGTPGGPTQTAAQYRAQVLTAGMVAATGMPNMLQTLLQAVPGVQANLIAVRIPSAGKWEIIVGGTGDPYAIGEAIYAALFDISTLVGSTLSVTSITNANPGVVTTSLNHGYATDQVVFINGAGGISGINGTALTITVLSETTFSIGVNTTSSGTYTGGGVATPNFRNVSVTINDYPDNFTIPFVLPPLQTVTMAVVWNTSGLNYVSDTAVSQLAAPALASYVNGIAVGSPMNTLEMTAVFQAAVLSLIPTALLTRLVFTVYINGVETAAASGTGIIAGDPESYFSIAVSAITVAQG